MGNKDQAFTLDEFLKVDRFYQIYLKRRDKESDFFYIYTDYLEYLQYLNIIWDRIRKECATYYRNIFTILETSQASHAQQAVMNEMLVKLVESLANATNQQTINSLAQSFALSIHLQTKCFANCFSFFGLKI